MTFNGVKRLAFMATATVLNGAMNLTASDIVIVDNLPAQKIDGINEIIEGHSSTALSFTLWLPFQFHHNGVRAD